MVTGPIYEIRAGVSADAPVLVALELRAASRFEGSAHAEVADMGPRDESEFRTAALDGRLWVAIGPGDDVAGFALAVMVGEHPHLEELDVDLEHGRRGVGTALLGAVIDWARGAGAGRLTLTTYVDIPWNAPFYRRVGFQDLEPSEQGLELEALIAREHEQGLDRACRVAMAMKLSAEG